MVRQVTSLPVKELTVAEGNWDPSRAPIDQVIIHTMVGSTLGANARFNIPNEQASAHYGVCLNGNIVHWVDEDNTAYHCGNYITNQRSIGIEHEDNGDYNGLRTDELYEASAKLVRDICQFYNIPIDRQHILKHSEVSDRPTACPDSLDIDRIIKEANGAIIAQPIAQPEVTFFPQNTIKGLYLGILGVNASEDEIEARLEQLVAGIPYHDIVSQVLNEDGRSPLLKVKSDYNECLNRTYTVPASSGTTTPVDAPKTADNVEDESSLPPNKPIDLAPVVSNLLRWFIKKLGL